MNILKGLNSLVKKNHESSSPDVSLKAQKLATSKSIASDIKLEFLRKRKQN
jgi:hypothetical protein